MDRPLIAAQPERESQGLVRLASCQMRGTILLLNFSQGVTASLADQPDPFMLRINGATHIIPGGALSYDSASRTTSIRGLPVRRGDHVSVTIAGLWDQQSYIPEESVTCNTQVERASYRVWLGLALLAIAGLTLVTLQTCAA
jgi:hypothetical protein